MIDPVMSDSILLAAMSGALIVVFGALFAVLYAFARLKGNRQLMYMAYLNYFLLVVSAIALSRALNLDGYWTVIVVIMLAGYFAGPHVIWKLCVKTHR